MPKIFLLDISADNGRNASYHQETEEKQFDNDGKEKEKGKIFNYPCPRNQMLKQQHMDW